MGSHLLGGVSELVGEGGWLGGNFTVFRKTCLTEHHLGICQSICEATGKDGSVALNRVTRTY